MTASLQTGDLLTLIGSGHLKLPHGSVAALRERRHGRDLPALQRGLALGKKPGVAEYAPADHGHIGTGVLEDSRSVFRLEDIAVGNDRNGDGLLYLADVIPVGGTGIHLVSGAAMYGYGGYAGLLHGFGELDAVDRTLIPAQTELDRNGAAGTTDDGFSHLHRQIGVAHQAGTVTGVCHFGNGAAHVNVNKIRAGDLVGDGGSLLHTDGITAENLGCGGMLGFTQLQQGNGFFVLIAKSLCADHLCAGQAGTLLPADGAKSNVRNTCHGAKC